MSDQSPPKKVNSLRDRIAAFEKQSTAQPSSLPVPRPKPTGTSWKPKQPPPSPACRGSFSESRGADHDTNVISGSRAGGMSAADAKESISQAGSLKDRMAALQGKGAFGADSSSTPPPKPASDKPKWKPPPQPVASPSSTIEKDQQDLGSVEPQASEGAEAVESIGNTEVDESVEPLGPEEEERQRRAAIAARLQRLGGSKIGMAPPIFGVKPAFKKPSLPREEDSKAADEISEEHRSSLDSAVHISPVPGASPSPPAGSKSPSSMPVPAVPRRAAPPRRKPGKSVSPTPSATIELDETTVVESPAVSVHEPDTETKEPQSTSSIDDTIAEKEEEVVVGSPLLESAPAIEGESDSGDNFDFKPADLDAKSLGDKTTPVLSSPNPHPGSLVRDRSSLTGVRAAVDGHRRTLSDDSVNRPESPLVTEEVAGEMDDMDAVAVGEDEIERLTGIEQPKELLEEDTVDKPESQPIETAVGIEHPSGDDEEDDAIRRARIAERLAKSGGINPFAAGTTFASLPRRKSSMSTTASRKDSIDSSGEPPSGKPSIDVDSSSRKASFAVPTAPKQTAKEDSEEVDAEETDHQIQEQNEQETSIHQDYLPLEQGNEELVETLPTVVLATSASILGTTQDENEDDDQVHTPLPIHRVPVGSEHEEDDQESSSLPPPRRTSLPPPPPPRAPSRPIGREVVNVKEETPPLPLQRHVPMLPPPPPIATRPPVPDAEESHNKQVSPPLPPSKRFSVPPPPPLHNTPDVSSHDAPSSDSSYTEEDYDDSFEIPAHHTSDDVRQQRFAQSEPESEILDDSDCDPIDPGFLSAIRSPKGVVSPPAPPPPPRDELPTQTPDMQSTTTNEDSDEEQGRRRRLADRMAKLGGIRFGASPPVHRPPPNFPLDQEAAVEIQESSEKAEENRAETEEDDQARRQRITAKLAGMGGMRFGMLPPGVPGGPLPPPAHAARSPARAPHTLDVESISEDECVKVEAEESEMEEVNYEDVEEEGPSPVSTRQAKPAVSQPENAPLLSSGGRPPVPGPTVFASRRPSVRKSSTDSNASYQAPPRVVPHPSEYVMVEEPYGYEGEPAPPPPPRPARAPPPSRSVPPPAPPGIVNNPDSLASSQWELPSIPSGSLDLGGTGDLSLSAWSEDSTSYPSITNTARPPSLDLSSPTREASAPTPVPQGDASLSAEQLNLVWGRVGVQICEVAAELLEKSKKALIGDGTYIGFLNAVLSRVPNASQFQPNSMSFGYLIYAQTGTTVQKRIADIMPGDIIVVHDAKLKGHKGLQTYHRNIGEGEPLLGIVGDFEAKKSKVRVYQANQHVGHQTVESVSYRLEDLKSGTIQVFRVLES